MDEARLARLSERLSSIKLTLEREMRARGFDPAQLENTALPTSLARLSAERDEIERELKESEVSFNPKERMQMSELERIEQQLGRAFEGGAWHGPAVLEVLKDVNAQQAAARPVPGAHSIWELVLHITAWEGACRRRLDGERAEVPDVTDWPKVTSVTDEAWQAAKEKLVNGNRELRKKILSIDETTLDQPILPGMSSIYQTIHGVVQHDLYHAGQIALLKRALESSKTTGMNA
ncbi:MAG: hypothetical protein C5B44_06980 [Acidobacteria bacterium]|nr:MAG: hypothetical protein C5B44_06980 [Acidobacteriota bacterium]